MSASMLNSATTPLAVRHASISFFRWWPSRRWTHGSGISHREWCTTTPTVLLQPPAAAARCVAGSPSLGRAGFTVGIGGPVGSGKTALVKQLCRHLRDEHSIAVVTNDIFTQEDAEFLMRNVRQCPPRRRSPSLADAHTLCPPAASPAPPPPTRLTLACSQDVLPHDRIAAVETGAPARRPVLSAFATDANVFSRGRVGAFTQTRAVLEL